MARRQRFAQDELTELETIEAAKKRIERDKLVLIVFNERFYNCERKNMEYSLNMCRPIYENKHGAHCYKCVVSLSDDRYKVDPVLKITSLPTILLFRDGKEVDRIERANVLVSNIPKEERDALDYSLRKRLNHWCTLKDTVPQQKSANTGTKTT